MRAKRGGAWHGQPNTEAMNASILARAQSSAEGRRQLVDADCKHAMRCTFKNLVLVVRPVHGHDDKPAGKLRCYWECEGCGALSGNFFIDE